MFLTDTIVADRTTTLPCPVIAHDMPLAAAIDLFRERPGLRVLPVVDRHHRPVGVVPEIAVRRILFNPYGHALMQNPSFGGRLTNLMVPCPVAEIGWPAARQLESHAAIGGEALILTSGGRFHSMLDAPALLALAARVEAAATGDRIARAERIDAAVAAFASGAEELASNLHDAAGAIVAMSSALAERARETLGNASAVAAASMQTSDALSDIAARENDLVDALARIDRDMRDARRIRADTTTRLAAAVGRVATLANSATSIDSMSTLIQEVAARTNLISLNASIEAARAGEAGRGFAVVATEVKALAGQTKGTAQAITGQVERIGDLIGGVIADQDRIGQDVALIDRLSSSIDDAVERQTTATATVSAALGQSAMASRAIGEDARRIGADADQLRQDVDGLLQLSASLTTIAGQMTAKTTAFIEAIDV